MADVHKLPSAHLRRGRAQSIQATARSLRLCGPRLGQREHDDRRRTAASEESGYDAGSRGHVLLACDLVADDAATDRAAGVESIERLAVARVDGEEVAIEIAGEEHAARGGGDA